MNRDYKEFNEEQDPESQTTHRVKSQQTITINSGPLDVLVMNEEDQVFWTSKRLFTLKFSIMMIVTILFNSGPIYFFYLIFSFKQLYKLLMDENEELQIKKKYALKFIWDYFLCLNVLSVFLVFSQFTELNTSVELDRIQEDYYHWIMNCILFIILFAIFITYKELLLKYEEEIEQAVYIKQIKYLQQTQKAEEDESKTIKYHFQFPFSYLVSERNFHCIGLGLSQRQYKHSLEEANRDKEKNYTHQFMKEIDHILKRENLDPTLIYFAITADERQTENKERFSMENLKEQQYVFQNMTLTQPKEKVNKEVLSHLHKLGFTGTRDIFRNFMLPHYIHTRQYLKQHPTHNNLIIMMIILIKIIIPTLMFISPITFENFLIGLILSGFYLHFMNCIVSLVLNDDLKTKNYIFLALIKIMSVQDFVSNSDANLDITCALSLQGWNTMRHITLMIDRKKKRYYNFVFGFLVLYGKLCFVAFILCRFDLPFMKNINYCREEIVLYNVHIDIALVAAISMFRIYQGSKFNETFEQTREVNIREFSQILQIIHRLTAVYEDLFTLFEFYFSDGIASQVHNVLYATVIKAIKESAQQRFQTKDEQSQEEEESEYNFSNEQLQYEQVKVEELKDSMEKIQESVDYDERKYRDKFLGIYDSDLKMGIKIVVVVCITFVPGIFKKYIQFFIIYFTFQGFKIFG